MPKYLTNLLLLGVIIVIMATNTAAAQKICHVERNKQGKVTMSMVVVSESSPCPDHMVEYRRVEDPHYTTNKTDRNLAKGLTSALAWKDGKNIGQLHTECVARWGDKRTFFKNHYQHGMFDKEYIEAVWIANQDLIMSLQSFHARRNKLFELAAAQKGFADRESSNYPCSTSSAGAWGLMQVVESSYKSECRTLGILGTTDKRNLPNPYGTTAKDIACGAFELRFKLEYVAGKVRQGHAGGVRLDPSRIVEYWAAAYNAGTAEFHSRNLGWGGWLRNPTGRSDIGDYARKVAQSRQHHLSDSRWFDTHVSPSGDLNQIYFALKAGVR